MIDIKDVRELGGSRMREILGLSTLTVGVRFLMEGDVEGLRCCRGIATVRR